MTSANQRFNRRPVGQSDGSGVLQRDFCSRPAFPPGVAEALERLASTKAN